MGGCCSSRDSLKPEEAARQLEAIFILSNKDFVRKGTQEDMVKYYDILDQETQSHANCYTSILTDKASGENRFCKTIVKTEAMPLKQIEAACNYMGQVSHTIVVKVQEVYYGNGKIHLVSNSLKGSHRPLSSLETVLSESQIARILQKLLQMCAKLLSDGVTIANLHADNVFIDEDYPEDVLVTDVGFAYVPDMEQATQMQKSFLAPELADKTGIELEKAIGEHPGQSDMYSIGCIAKFLCVGSLEYAAEDLGDQISEEMGDFIRRVESERPVERMAARSLLGLPLFDNGRLAQQEADLDLIEQRNAQKSAIAARMKAMGQASIMQQIMVRFVSSAQQNQAQLRKCRLQYQQLLDEQNKGLGEGAPLEDKLRFDTVRALLKETTGGAESQRILRELDVDLDARISFEEFQSAMVATSNEQDEAVLRSSFRRLDVNGDKYLSMDEILSTLTRNEDALHRVGKAQGFRTEILNFISQNDADGNKKLDEAEFIKAMKSLAVSAAVDEENE